MSHVSHALLPELMLHRRGTLALVLAIQRRNYAAARSHRKRTLRRLLDTS